MSVHYVLDSSALLAVLYQEKGMAKVAPILENSSISAVNLCEVFSKIKSDDMPFTITDSDINDMGIDVVPFATPLISTAADLIPLTKKFGLSLGDRACLATALRGMPYSRKNIIILTADKIWKELDIELLPEIRLIR